MKNIPRIFIDQNIKSGIAVPAPRDVAHYLSHVMRNRDCLVFNSGDEFNATLSDDSKNIIIGDKTNHIDPSNDICIYFAPIKKLDDMLNMATQMGVKCFVPVITQYTVANHINWDRMRKIVIEASEQSNRNSVPTIAQPIKFADLPFDKIVFADERAAHGREIPSTAENAKNILIGPEGGFSESEFETLDKNGASGLSLGKTILRAEVAPIVAIAKVIK